MFSPLSGLLAPVLILAMSPDTPVDSVRLKIVGPNGQPLQGATVRIGDGPRKPTENAEIVIPFGGKRLSVTVYGPLPSHGGSPGYQEEVFEIPRSVEELHVGLKEASAPSQPTDLARCPVSPCEDVCSWDPTCCCYCWIEIPCAVSVPCGCGLIGSGGNMSATTTRPVAAVRTGDARLSVSVPDDAVVFINGNRTTKIGTHREYVSTGLKASHSYRYVVRVQVSRDGTVLENVREVIIRAGGSTHLVFDAAGREGVRLSAAL
jgi:uncharacterized protein (TIGR03000 family)